MKFDKAFALMIEGKTLKDSLGYSYRIVTQVKSWGENLETTDNIECFDVTGNIWHVAVLSSLSIMGNWEVVDENT